MSTSKPRIAFFLPSLRGGGAQRVCVQIANALSISNPKIGIDLIVAELEGNYRSEINSNVNLICFDCSRTLFSLWALIKYLNISRPNVLFCGQPHSGVVAWLAKKFSSWRGKLIIRETNSSQPIKNKETNLKSRITRIIIEYVYKKIDCVIAPSIGVMREISGNVQVIPNPIDFSTIKNKISDPIEIGGLEGKKFILGVGRLSKQKRFGDLIKAFSLLVPKDSSLRLVILGEGSDKLKLIKLTEELKISHLVYFMGFDLNPYKYMSRCAVYVLSSGWEGLPNTLLQAMACNAFVVATNCPHGPSEILENGRWGDLVTVGDIQALSQAIDKALSEKKIRYTKEILEKYKIDNVINAYQELFLGKECHQEH